MSEVTLFKNSHGCVHVALASGKTVAFTEGKFFTTNKALEAELTVCAETAEFGIYIDTNESKIDPEFATPMDQLKKKLRDELLAELAAGGRLVDAGTYVQSPSALQTSMATTSNAPGGTLSPAAEALRDAQIADMKAGEQPKLSEAEQKLAALKAGAKA